LYANYGRESSGWWRAHPSVTLIGRHVERLRETVGKPLDVVGINQNGVVTELLRRAGQLAQHEHTFEIFAGRDELLRHQVHPVVQRADETEVGQPVQRHQPSDSQRRLAVADRTPSQAVARVSGVDGGHPLVDVRLDRLVALELRP